MPTKITGTSNPVSTNQSPTITQIIQSLAYTIKKLSGGNNYYDEPPVSITELNNDINNLADLSDSQARRISALEARVFPITLWRYGADVARGVNTNVATLASYTIDAGVVDSGSRVLILEAGFSTPSTTGTRTMSVAVGNTTIWTGTLAANTSTPVRKVISFNLLRQNPRTFNTGNNGYTQTTTAPLTDFADFRQAQTISIRGSATASMTVNIDYALLTMI